MSESKFPLESLLSPRQLLSPQLVGDYIYFLSNMGGSMGLYRMRSEGSFPELLLPAGVALQNPHLMIGESFVVFPRLQQILVMIDHHGDENYQACLVPLEGGIPKSAFGDKYRGQQLGCTNYDRERGLAYFTRDDRKTPDRETIRLNLKTLAEDSFGKSVYGNICTGTNEDHSMVALQDGYTALDDVLFLRREDEPARELLYGTPIERREKGKEYPLTGFGRANFSDDGKGILLSTTFFEDRGSLAFLPFAERELRRVVVVGMRHRGTGEMGDLVRVAGTDRYLLNYNIEGCSWIYEGRFAGGRSKLRFAIERTIVGRAPVSDGVALGIGPQASSSGIGKKKKNRRKGRVSYAFSFTRATYPSQLFIRDGGSGLARLSSERVLGIPEGYLSQGEDASYESFDGLRINARLYLPSNKLKFAEPYPLVLYDHGGPQAQERPDFTWFSMPLIQYLTLNGIAVFVPNVRGSTGYGLKFMKMVDHDWGGKDRLDLIEGLKVLERRDSRVDSTRRGVIGRSYGGYMTLTLASRHPELWKAAVDMFGPYNLRTFIERLPETWRTYFYLAVGHPDRNRDFLLERSPSTYIDNVRCAMLMIQGRNDPRVVERETRDVVERLRSRGVPVDYLVFEDEGHDVIKFNNRVTCYSRITSFFAEHLGPTATS